MPSTAILFGRILVFIGILGYGYGLVMGNASLTALIPAVVGVVLLGLGHIAKAKENLRKHLMHVAVIVALLGFLASAGRLISKISEFSISVASVSQIAMALTCLIFIVLCVQSFINARKSE